MDNLEITVVAILILICLKISLFNRSKQSKSIMRNKKVPSEKPYFHKNFSFDEQNNTVLTKSIEIILKNNLGQELSFKRPDGNLNNKYQEVKFGELNKISSHIVQGPLLGLGHAQYLKQIAKSAPNGLFTTVADPSTLSKFANHSFSTMVRDSNNNLIAHEGFLRTNLPEINPLLALNTGMQAMAIITGQYYLKQIYSRLDNVNSNLKKLITTHNDEKIGVLLNARRRLSEIVSRKVVDETDINEIRTLGNKLGEIYQEYKIRLDREQESVSKSKSKAWYVEKRVNNYLNDIDEMSFTLQVAFECDRISMQAELVEIAVRLKRDYKDPMLEELFNQLKNSCKDSFSVTIKENIETIFAPINENAKVIVGSGKDFRLINKDQKKLLESILNKPEYLKERLSQNIDKQLFTKVLLDQNKEKIDFNFI